MSFIRKTSVFSKLMTTGAIFLIALIVVSALWAVSVPEKIYAEDAVSSDYSSVGQTDLRTTANGGEGTIDQSGGVGADDKTADDFSLVGDLVQFRNGNAANRVAFSMSGMRFVFIGASGASEQFSLRSEKKIASGSALQKALDAPDHYRVSAEIAVTTEFSRDKNILVETAIIWNNGSGDLISDSRKQSQSGALSFKIDLTDTVSAADASLAVEFSFPADSGANTDVDVLFTAVSVRFSVALKDGNYESSLDAELTGANRLPVKFAAGDNQRRYVKSDDSVALTLGFKKNGTDFILGESFKDVFSRASAVDWTAELKATENSDGAERNFNNLFTARETGAGQFYTFLVPSLGEADNGKVIVLTPSLNTDTANPGATLGALAGVKIVLYVDSIRPADPILTERCDLARFLKELKNDPSKYYTEATIGIDWVAASTPGSKETLYYTVTETDWPNAAETPNVYSPKIEGDNKYLEFFPNGAAHKGGRYALAILLIDEAGNVSGNVGFDSVIAVDDNDYVVYANAKKGKSGASRPAAKEQTELGIFRFNGVSNAETFNAKRGEEVSLVYTFSELKLKNFRLSNLYNGNNETFSLSVGDYGADSDPMLTVTVNGNGDTVYTFTFTVDKTETRDFISNAAARDFTFLFKYHAYPEIPESSKTRTFRADSNSVVNKVPTRGLPQTIDVGGFYYYENGVKTSAGSLDYQITYGEMGADGTITYRSEPYTLAGEYYYRITLMSGKETDYFMSEEGNFTIKKADPGVEGFVVQPPQSLYSGSVPAIEFGTAGGIGLFKILSRDPDNMLTDRMTSIGLRGYFDIINMRPGDEAYRNPGVGTHSLSIVFRPENPNDENGVLNSNNYDVSSAITAEIAVLKKDINNTGDMVFMFSPDGSPDKAVVLDGNTEIFYNGNAVSLFLQISRLSKYGIVSTDVRYEFKAEGGDYGPTVPDTAGKYGVRATISDRVGSYRGTTEASFEIRKQNLTVHLSDPATLAEFVYGYFTRPQVRARTESGGFVAVDFIYRYQRIGAVGFDAEIPVNAGDYAVEITVNDVNYEGKLVWNYTIRKVRIGDAGLTVNNPLPQTMPGIGAKLRFGMPLSEMVLSRGSVEYVLSSGEKIYVSGSFRAASQGGADASYIPTADEILKNRYYAFNFVFTPEGNDRDNFETLTSGSSVDIQPATLDFAGIAMPAHDYGLTTRELLAFLTGKATFRFGGVVTEIDDGSFEYIGNNPAPDAIPEVGTYTLLFRYVAAGGKQVLYESPTEFELELTVTERALELYLTDEEGAEISSFTRVYGTTATVSADRVKVRGDAALNLEYVFRYFKNNVDGALSGENPDVVSADVGRYYLEISVRDRNYSGSAVVELDVELYCFPDGGTNVSQYPAALNALEWGVSTKALEAQYEMRGALYRGDAAAEAFRRTDGTFSFVRDESFPDPAAAVTVRIRFTPDDEKNYCAVEFDYLIPVNKRTVSFVYEGETVFNGAEQLPEFVLYDGDRPIDAADQKYVVLFPDGTPLQAGKYAGTVSVDAAVERYRGSVAIAFEVKPQAAEVRFDAPEGGYFAGSGVVPNFTVVGADGALAGDLDGEITIRFKNHLGEVLGSGIFDGSIPVYAPKNVGVYTVEVLLGGNHAGEAEAQYALQPTAVGVDTVVVVRYLDEGAQNAEITPIRDGYRYNYRLEYRLAGTDTYDETLPKDAGQYEVRVTLDENGFQRAYELGIKYTVTALEVTEITSDRASSFVYEIVAPELSFTAFGAGEEAVNRLAYVLSYFDASGAALLDAPAHAGNYAVTVNLAERNYYGSKRFEYTIERGSELKNFGAVELTAVEYKTEFADGVTDGIFATRGSFVYAAGGVQYKVTGVFRVTTEGFTSFGVGSHGVTYEFRATAAERDGANYDIFESDLAAYRDVTNVSIVKKRLAKEDFSVDARHTDEYGNASTEYDETQQGVTVKAISAFFSPKEAKDVAANAVVTYQKSGTGDAATTSRPSLAGRYEVAVSIKHDNYEGEFTLAFVIEKAKPDYVKPSYVKKAGIGDEAYGAGARITSTEPLYAHYRDKRGTPIAGTFTVTDSVTFTAANLQNFTAVFTPDDPDNVQTDESVVLTVYVVAAADRAYAVSAAWFESLRVDYYGSIPDLSQLRLKSGVTDITLTDGVATVKDANGRDVVGRFYYKDADTHLPDYGTQSQTVYFVPESGINPEYQVVSIHLPVTVANKAQVGVRDNVVYATVTPGGSYSDAEFAADLFIVSAVAEGVSLNPPVGFRFSDAFDLTAQVPESANLLPDNARAVYLGDKNFESEFGDYEVRFVFSVKEAGILADNLTREFYINPQNAVSLRDNKDGKWISDVMGITFSGAGDTVPEYEITVENPDALTEDPQFGKLFYNIGVYEVTVVISKSSGYYGRRTFRFEIVKRNIGDYIAVNGNRGGEAFGKVYLESLNFIAAAYAPTNGVAYDADFRITFRNKDGGDFTETAPVNAGNYILRAEVDQSDDRYYGYREYDYTIEKKTIAIAQTSVTQTFGNAPAELTPRLDENVGWDFRFTDAEGKTIYNTYPVNAGEYTGRIEVNDPNFKGAASFAYTIDEAQVTITALPVYGALRYGQKLSEASVLHDGAAMVTLGGGLENADGIFEFVNPGLVLDSGENRAVEIRFTPFNKNYRVVSGKVPITVERADVTIGIGQTEFRYDGTALDLSRVYTVYPAAGILPEYEIRRNDAGGERVAEIVGAGVYYVAFTIDTVNYTSEAEATIRIAKGTADAVQTDAPRASSLTFGQRLKNSALTGGSVRYNGMVVPGTFRYVLEDATPDRVDTVDGVPYSVVFTPDDSANYAPYSGYTVYVKIDKAPLEIKVSGNESVYGETVTIPLFEVSGMGGTGFSFKLEERFQDWIGKTMPAGSIETKVTLESDYYYGEQNFVYTVKKKSVGIRFYTTEDRLTAAETYASVYGELFKPYAGLTGLVLSDEPSAFNAQILIEYRLADGSISISPPKSAGDGYWVLARYTGDNYNADAEIRYTVTRARVNSIAIDSELLNKQIYGSVLSPTVVTSPAGIETTLDFGGGVGLPDQAGSYHLTVTVTDPNYERYEKGFVFVVNPKRISVESIVVSNKVYDGVATLSATGALYGLMTGDEVNLTMFAETADGKSDPGEHGVKITAYALKGRHAANYVLDPPVYTKNVTIFASKVVDSDSDSHLVFLTGMPAANMTVAFTNAVSSQNKENFFSALLGQKAQVISFTIKTDGIKTDLADNVRVYVKIPERFLSAKNLKLEWAGAMEGTPLNFTIQGEYAVFETSRSGEIVFVVSEFPYGLILVIAGFAVAGFGILAIAVFEPIRKKKALMFKMRDDKRNK